MTRSRANPSIAAGLIPALKQCSDDPIPAGEPGSQWGSARLFRVIITPEYREHE